MANLFNVLRNKSPRTKARLVEQMGGAVARRKTAARSAQRRSRARAQAAALGAAPFVYVSKNYTNPVTLNAPPLGVIVYRIKNRTTGRIDYYNVKTMHKLTGKNNYGILIADPTKSLFRNPMTRGPVHPRNVQRVRLRQAESKIARTVRKKKNVRKSH